MKFERQEPHNALCLGHLFVLIFFLLKDRIQLALKPLVVCKFQCSSCNTTYIGKSKRHLKIRFSEQAGFFDWMGIILKCPKESAVFAHFGPWWQYCPRPSTLDDFSVFCAARNDLEIQIKESILIGEENPELNRNVCPFLWFWLVRCLCLFI